jgi:hypothetical protein
MCNVPAGCFSVPARQLAVEADAFSQASLAFGLVHRPGASCAVAILGVVKTPLRRVQFFMRNNAEEQGFGGLKRFSMHVLAHECRNMCRHGIKQIVLLIDTIFVNFL